MRRSDIGLGCGYVGIVLGVLALVAVLGIGAWGFTVLTAEWKGRGDAHIQINSGANRIAQYDKFHNACASIKGLEGQIDEVIVQIADTSDERTLNILRTNLTGVKSARHRAIAQYNEDALKNYTDGQFRDSDLPYQIADTNYPDEGGKTRCAAQ